MLEKIHYSLAALCGVTMMIGGIDIAGERNMGSVGVAIAAAGFYLISKLLLLKKSK